MLLSPTGIGSVMFTVPFSSVVVVMFVPFGNVTITVALLIGSSVTGSVRFTSIVVFSTVLLVTLGVTTASLPTTFTSSRS